MQLLVAKFRGLIQSINSPFKRSLFHRINWSGRGIRIDGARGVGKSTLMLQFIKEQLPIQKTLYLTLDDLYFKQHTLTEVAEEFYQYGGRHLFLDEVHKYANWPIEVKNLYDFKPDLQLVISGSSILALQKSTADLSRRVINYKMPELSFREYLALTLNIELPNFTLEEILSNHEAITSTVLEKLDSPLAHYKHFEKFGAYPFFIEGEADYFVRLNQLINIIIDYDLPEAKALEGASLSKLKKLLYILSRAVPFKPNINKLAEDIGTNRTRVLELLDMLEKAQLIRFLRSETQGISLMNKPEKIYLHNTNFIHALADEKPNEGNLRETLLLGQLQDAGLSVTYPTSGDFLVNGKYLLEVGGKNRSDKQIKNHDYAYIVADNIESGFGKKIPLWLFGFLY
jgi:uncharacterized protein